MIAVAPPGAVDGLIRAADAAQVETWTLGEIRAGQIGVRFS
jgi:hypothetical protein